MHHYYRHRQLLLISSTPLTAYSPVREEEARQHRGPVAILGERDPSRFRRRFLVSEPDLLTLDRENLDLLDRPSAQPPVFPDWLELALEERRVVFVNTAHPRWEEALEPLPPPPWRIHVFGLGDVGSSLALGLRVLGGELVSRIGVYARRPAAMSRLEQELNQIMPPEGNNLPPVQPLEPAELFQCEMLVFCASTYVPAVGEEPQDVRLAQYRGNSAVIADLARQAREESFPGILAVMSDPVDLLAAVAFREANRHPQSGQFDARGLAPEQIRGYGLGVMHTRARYFAEREDRFARYLQEGRIFGPHGHGVVVADSLESYQDQVSRDLTQLVETANLQVRKLGYKPYLAPALSSGAYSLLAALQGQWHYSATFLGGVFFGARNRLLPWGTELERRPLPRDLRLRLEDTYRQLEEMR